MKQKAKEKRLQRRIKAYENPQSSNFEQQKREGGARMPGSYRR